VQDCQIKTTSDLQNVPMSDRPNFCVVSVRLSGGPSFVFLILANSILVQKIHTFFRKSRISTIKFFSDLNEWTVSERSYEVSRSSLCYSSEMKTLETGVNCGTGKNKPDNGEHGGDDTMKAMSREELYLQHELINLEFANKSTTKKHC
jgi:hypothetical protein